MWDYWGALFQFYREIHFSISITYICLVFRREDKKIISQIYQDGKVCGQFGDRMSDNDCGV